MRRAGLAALAALSLLAAGCAHEEAIVEPPGELAGVGAVLGSARCGSCHATGRHDESPQPDAPRFRHLARLYHFEVLEVELREGVHVGDQRMPQFSFTVDETDALIAYLRSIQHQ